MKGKNHNMIKYRTMLTDASKDNKELYLDTMRAIRKSARIKSGRDYIVFSRGISGRTRTKSRRRIIALMTTEDNEDAFNIRKDKN